MIAPLYFLLASAAVFALGAVGIVSSRHAVRMLMSAEVMLNGSLLALLAAAATTGYAAAPVVAILAITLAGAEAVTAVSVIILLYRKLGTLDVQQII